MYFLNFTAFIVCAIAAVLQGIMGHVGLCLVEILLALLNLPYAIVWLDEMFR